MGEPNDNGEPTWQDQLHEQAYGPPDEVEPTEEIEPVEEESEA